MAETLSFFLSEWEKCDPAGFGARAEKKETVLETIARVRLADVAEAASALPLSELKTKVAAEAPPAIDFYARLKAVDGMAVLAEIKRASPSKGLIAADTVAEEQGKTYAEAGAAAISVLCEPHWFKGSLNDLKAVRAAVGAMGEEKRPALLRKDFLLDEYQLWEARLYGADTVLLIVAILDDATLAALMAAARELGMEPLVEVANAPEMERARALGARVIGINNRNLHDFTVNMDASTQLTAGLDKDGDTIFLALSGITGPSSVSPYRTAGLHGVLVGEALMRADDVAAAIEGLRTVSAIATVSLVLLSRTQHHRRPFRRTNPGECCRSRRHRPCEPV